MTASPASLPSKPVPRPQPSLAARNQPLAAVHKTKPRKTAAPSVAETAYVLNPVQDSHVEELIKAKAIGAKIRKLRLKRSMGLLELGQKTGMSASYISQLETGRVVPTLRNLSRIALVFNKQLTFFFEEKKQNCFRISRSSERVRLPMGEKTAPHLIAESMSVLIPDRSLVPCIADFLPNTRNASFEPCVFRGQEFVYVVHGSITLFIEDKREILEAEDIAWIDGGSRRHYHCNENKPARAIIITCPR